MTRIHLIKKPLRMLRVLYLVGFFFSVHLALTAYVNSTFLGQYINPNLVGVLFAISYLIGIIGVILIPKILNKVGGYKTILFLILINILTLSSLFFLKSVYLLVPLFITYIVINIMISFSIDIFVENFSENKSTGKIRGLFLTIINFAWVFAPLLTGFVLSNNSPSKIYLISSFFVIPVLFIFLFRFKKFKDPKYNHLSIKKSLLIIKKNKDIKKIFQISFLLQFFYAWMVIYMPIYLIQYIGFGWDKIGIIFTIMLLPFILFELPLGKLADTRLGEKEILIIGFIIIAISTLIIPFLKTTNVFVWALVLFLTRTGASAIQVMSETYFFKKTKIEDMEVIGLFRGLSNFAWVLAPLLASLFLIFFNYKYLFLVLGILMIGGIYLSSVVQDTK
ncbi:hypothetical protein A2995_00460 [Candidatus Nomurabacteria bacterium RIFCSPLOWO2_01_FULL_33_24]|uniref:Major facilitator superfamily (MFS) profile domain-containing protein n=1 Tax=Candidatus Nomurabacteria bacterium RIFCSPLOWO2_01_FULL_33_24 TaxID=1801765 RepID=A0A1F6WYQ5_9BACT|nr:MAG: hypothetical protein A2995_00460 [Candidatus Nomurabacteria bacterium RIFCSPLOWO2_01_FULL_33_24]